MLQRGDGKVLSGFNRLLELWDTGLAFIILRYIILKRPFQDMLMSPRRCILPMRNRRYSVSLDHLGRTVKSGEFSV